MNHMFTEKTNRKTLESPEKQSQLEVETAIDPFHRLILYNDDVNTFDHVIKALMEICDHTEEQAEQCALIVHHAGKCEVKTGSYDDLKPRCERLLERGLSASIVKE